MLEWISAATGLILAIGILGFIGWQAITARQSLPPAVSVMVERIMPTPAGYVVELVARNHSGATAADVMIEGTLKQGGATIERSQATIAYVPGRSVSQAGLFFKRNPSELDLEVRAVGYERP